MEINLDELKYKENIKFFMAVAAEHTVHDLALGASSRHFQIKFILRENGDFLLTVMSILEMFLFDGTFS
ncbi:hypothetical protein T07_6314 [Trichinella nelsoni]|uniref:Uncharacterized protein n=1 Tax=Trichinella nelsoni TaxID=6336 RepID=A0A0V0S636_9BILA|nr:hypothetical protein T07_6314 [Trichinella nelsoni]